jgi:hypothetical protein
LSAASSSLRPRSHLNPPIRHCGLTRAVRLRVADVPKVVLRVGLDHFVSVGFNSLANPTRPGGGGGRTAAGTADSGRCRWKAVEATKSILALS